MDTEPFDLDLGSGVTLRWIAWGPDRELNPAYADLPDDPRHAAFIDHTFPSGEPCAGMILFDTEAARRSAPDRPMWTVVSWEPLTVEPSILCRICGHHGYIREGRWVSV